MADSVDDAELVVGGALADVVNPLRLAIGDEDQDVAAAALALAADDTGELGELGVMDRARERLVALLGRGQMVLVDPIDDARAEQRLHQGSLHVAPLEKRPGLAPGAVGSQGGKKVRTPDPLRGGVRCAIAAM